jgi:hypothetical protein
LSELNNDFFSVERSIDGNNWISISTQKGQGNSSNTKQYKDYDYFPLNKTAYYRLRQTDFDGKSETFGLQAVNMKSFNHEPSAFPNPTSGILNVVNVDENTDLVLRNMDGKKIEIFFKSDGKTHLVCDLNNLKSGIYFLELKSLEKTHILKILKD